MTQYCQPCIYGFHIHWFNCLRPELVKSVNAESKDTEGWLYMQFVWWTNIFERVQLLGSHGVVRTWQKGSRMGRCFGARWCSCYTLSRVLPFVTPRTVVCQAPLSTEFRRQAYWSGLPFPIPGDLPDPGIKPVSPAASALAGMFLTTALPGKPTFWCYWQELLFCYETLKLYNYTRAVFFKHQCT